MESLEAKASVLVSLFFFLFDLGYPSVENAGMELPAIIKNRV